MSPLEALADALADPASGVPPGLACRPGADPAARLAIHRRTLAQGWQNCLTGSYPATRAAMGDAEFDCCARAFLAGPVPRPALLRLFAAGFPDFLATAWPDPRRPWLDNLARLEWLRIESFHAADAPALAASAWRPLLADPERLAATVVTLHPGCRWMRCGDGAGARWLAWQAGGRPDAGSDPSLPVGIVVSRPGHAVRVDLVDSSTLSLLDGLAAGRPLAAALAATAMPPAPLLHDLVDKRLASRLTPPPCETPT